MEFAFGQLEGPGLEQGIKGGKGMRGVGARLCGLWVSHSHG